MNKKKIYDFHTHISSLEVLEAYYDQDVIPVINCQSRDEFKGLIDKREVFSKDRIHFMDDLYYSMGIHPFDADIVDQQFGSSYEDLIKYFYKQRDYESVDKTNAIKTDYNYSLTSGLYWHTA